MFRGYFIIPGELVLLEENTPEGWKQVPLSRFEEDDFPSIGHREWPVKDTINFFVVWYGSAH